MERVHHLKAVGAKFWNLASGAYRFDNVPADDWRIGDYVVYRFAGEDGPPSSRFWFTRRIKEVRPDGFAESSGKRITFEPDKQAVPGFDPFGVASEPPPRTVGKGEQ